MPEPTDAKLLDRDSGSEEESDDEIDEEMEAKLMQQATKRGPRTSVSAEAYGAWNKKTAFTPVKVPKSDAQKQRLVNVLTNSFMFASLDKGNLNVVIDAMKEVQVKAGQTLIKEGEDGDCLYVVETGQLDCYKVINTENKKVKEIHEGDVVGELALLYSQPRAASVVGAKDTLCWSLDRSTFNHIVRDAAAAQREKYEKFLASVELFQKMDTYERAKIAEALKSEAVPPNTRFVTEGDEGHTFYVLKEGSAKAVKEGRGTVMEYKPGDYFGELALKKGSGKRQASIESGPQGCEVLCLGRKGFERLLGPVEELMARKVYN